MMKVTYTDKATFYAGVYQMVAMGLTFEADHATLTIVLTGGY